MLRSIARHLKAAVPAALIAGSAAGGIEGYVLFLANRDVSPPAVMIILLALMHAAYALYAGVPAALCAGIVAGRRAPGTEGGAGAEAAPRPLFGRYLLFMLAAYAFLWALASTYRIFGEEFFSVQGALVAVGAVPVIIILAFILSRPLRKAESGAGVFKMTVVGVWAALMVFLVFMGLQRPEAEAGGLTKKATPDKPNILYILVDALRADHVACYGYERATSDSVDALAVDGVLFEKCYAQASWTLPSVASMLTSTVPPRHGAVNVGKQLGAGMTIFPDRLGASGYRTAAFSANPLVSRTFGFHQGVDHYRSSNRSLARETGLRKTRLGIVHKMLWKLTQPRGADRAEGMHQSSGLGRVIFSIYNKTYDLILDIGIALRSELKGMGEEAAAINAEFLSWLDAIGDARFAAYLHYMEPHAPYNPDPPFAEMFPRDYTGDPVIRPPRRLEDPEKGTSYFPPLEEDAFADLVARYDGEIAQFSHEFGLLVKELKERGLYDDLLIVFVADHGDEFYEHQGWGHCHTVYNELVHVPLIIKFPGDAHAGLRIKSPCRVIDIVPTLLDFLKLPQWEEVEGKSFLALVNDGAAGADEPWSAISCTRAGGKIVRSYILGNHKLIFDAEAEEPWQLFDLSSDPGEQNSLVKQDPELFEKLKKMLVEVYDSYATEDAGADADMDEETRRKLKKLGYL